MRGITDSTGTLTGSTSYDAFGAVRAQTGSSLSLGYTGQLTDATTGFIDLRARQLDPTLGRFLSADSVQPNAPGTQGYNRYAYVGQQPHHLDGPEWACRRAIPPCTRGSLLNHPVMRSTP